MGDAFTRIVFHIVFSTKEQDRLGQGAERGMSSIRILVTLSAT